MRAWEIEKLSSQCQLPVQLEDNNEEIWLEHGTAQEESLHAAAKSYWGSRVPGSLFRDTMSVAAIQATENRGRIVERSDELLLAGFRAITENDIVELHRATHQLFEGCRNAVIDESADYWQYRLYDTFDQYAAAVRLPERQAVDMGAALEDRLHAGWLGQIIGGAYGTCMEGYTTDNILKAYSDLRRYIRKPNTYNDDITYELALLAAYEQHGAGTTSRDIAFEWLSRIGFGWSAEDMALRNLRCGIMPPESGRFNKPWGEWIGAQMRGTILGQLYPGDAAAAARAAWQDAEISHFHNGILGEVFNAILCAMAFCESDTRRLVQQAIDCIPADSQYGSVIRFALEQCRAHDDYLPAWRVCEKKLERYNWVHAYPNAAIEVIALWFGQGHFVDTLEICGICGKDSDCNAAQLMTILGSSTGMDGIPQDWAAPFQNRLDTYVRGMEHLSIRKLAARTAVVARRLAEVR